MTKKPRKKKYNPNKVVIANTIEMAVAGVSIMSTEAQLVRLSKVGDAITKVKHGAVDVDPWETIMTVFNVINALSIHGHVTNGQEYCIEMQNALDEMARARKSGRRVLNADERSALDTLYLLYTDAIASIPQREIDRAIRFMKSQPKRVVGQSHPS